MPEAQTSEAEDFATVADFWLARRGGSKYLLRADREKIEDWVRDCRALGTPMRIILRGVEDGFRVAREQRRAIYGFGWFDPHIKASLQAWIDSGQGR